MKALLLLSLLSFFSLSLLLGQKPGTKEEIGKLLLDNNQVKVIEYLSKPLGNVCGVGMHYHNAHLTVALTKSDISVTSADGKYQEIEIPAGAAIWIEAGTHAVINTGDEEAKFVLVYLKE